jgi:hypothetical protein
VPSCYACAEDPTTWCSLNSDVLATSVWKLALKIPSHSPIHSRGVLVKSLLNSKNQSA